MHTLPTRGGGGLNRALPPSLRRQLFRSRDRRHWRRNQEFETMMDLVYLGLTAGLLGLSFGLVRLCDRV